MSLREAREQARQLKLRVQQGGDPKRETEEARREQEAERAKIAREAAAAKAARTTLAAKLEGYRDVLATRGRSAKHQTEELSAVRLALASVSALELIPADITKDTIEKIMAVCPGGSRHARFGALDRFLRWVLSGTGQIAPTALFEKHERPRPVAARRRVLALHELAAVWRAADTLPNAVTRDLTQFLIAIPARESEAAEMKWEHVDLRRRVWHQPTSKNDDPHDFPLNEHALAILNRRREATGGVGLVFPGPKSGNVFVGWSNLKTALNARVQIAPWRIHDFRRSFVTHLGENGFGQDLLDLAINHRAATTRGGVMGVYQLSQRWAERVAPLVAWNSMLPR